MTRLTRSLLLSLIAAGIAALAIGGIGPSAAADRETVAVLVTAPPAKSAEGVMETKAAAVAPAALANRSTVGHRTPTLNQQRPLNEDLARFTRAF